MDECTGSQNELTKRQDPIPFYIPLMPFERTLLSELRIQIERDNYATYDGDRYPASKIFEEWGWAKKLTRSMKDHLGHDGEFMRTEHKGSRTVGYNALLTSFEFTRKSDGNLARSLQVRSVNESFLSNLSDRPIEDVRVQPWTEDIDIWQAASILWQHCGQYWKFGAYRDSGFAMFELIRKFTIQWKSKGNLDAIDQHLLLSSQFYRTYTVTPMVEDLDMMDAREEHINHYRFDIEKKVDPRNLPKWDANIPRVKDEQISMEFIVCICMKLVKRQILTTFREHLLSVSARTFPVEDPRSYLRYIPWAELTSTSEEELRQLNISLDVPFSERTATDSWVLWSPPLSGFAWNHHLNSEDEVYQYHVVCNWAAPDHFLSREPETIIFRASQLDKTDFIADIRNYWETWNDCALTVENDSGHVLLLETIPGVRYRSRRINQDPTAARLYFRNVVEAHANGSLDRPVLADIAGIDPAQILQFQHSLQFITDDELVSVDLENPLGSGQNGRVFKAKWKKPQRVLQRQSTEEEVIDVALKEVLPRHESNEQPLKKLLHELYLTYICLGAKPARCVKFLGIARMSGAQQELEKQSSTPIDKYYLVFECASEGSFVKFLEKTMRSEKYFQAWDDLIGAMSSMATGLSTLHKHNVLHRDLHDENILVTRQDFPDDPIYPFEYQYILSDIGEGKMLNPSSSNPNLPGDHYASYGNPQYRAPEVNGPSGWTKAADVWSLGMICLKLLEIRLVNCSDPIPSRVLHAMQEQHPDKDFSPSSHDVGFIVPSEVKRVLEPCFRRHPEERPDAHPLALGLGKAGEGFFVENKEQMEQNTDVKWTYWNWRETKAAALLGGNDPVRSQERNSLDLDLSQDVETLNLGNLPDLD